MSFLPSISTPSAEQVGAMAGSSLMMAKSAGSKAASGAKSAADAAKLGAKAAMTSDEDAKAQLAAKWESAKVSVLQSYWNKLKPEFRDFMLKPSAEKIAAHPVWVSGALALLKFVRAPLAGKPAGSATATDAAASGVENEAAVAPPVVAAAAETATEARLPVVVDAVPAAADAVDAASELGLPPECNAIMRTSAKVEPDEALRLLQSAVPFLSTLADSLSSNVQCFVSPSRLLNGMEFLDAHVGVPWNEEKGEFEWEGYEFARDGYQYELKFDERSLMVGVKEMLIEKVWGDESMTFRLLPNGLMAFGDETEGYMPDKGLFQRWRYDPATDQMEFVYWKATGNGTASLEDAFDDDIDQTIDQEQLEQSKAWNMKTRKSVLSGGRATEFKEWDYVNCWEGGNIPGKMVRVNA